MSIGRLIVEFEARTGKFETDTGRAAKIMEKRAREIDARAQKLAKSIGTALGVGVAGVATGLGVLVKRAIDAGDEFNKLAQKTGISTEALSALDFAAKQSGVEDLGESLIKLNRSMSEAFQGSKTQIAAFEALGVSIKDAQGNLRPTEQVLRDIADAFARFQGDQSSPAKVAIAMDLFGKSGAALIPLLNGGSKGLDQFMKRARELGLIIDGETAKASEDFNDALGELKFGLEGVGRSVAKEVSPSLKRLAEIITDPAFTAGIQKIVEGAISATEKVAKLVAAVGNIGTSQKLRELGREATSLADRLEHLEKGRKVLEGFGRDVDAELAQGRKRLAEINEEIRKLTPTDGVRLDAALLAEAEALERVGQKANEAAPAVLNYAGAADKADKASKKAKESTDEWAVSLESAAAIAAEAERLLGGLDAQAASVIEGSQSPEERFQKQIAELERLHYLGKLTDQQFNRARIQAEDSFGSMTQGLERVSDEAESTFGDLDIYAQRARENMQDAFAQFFLSFDQGAKGMVRSFAQAMQQMAAQAAAAEFLKLLVGNGEQGSSFGDSLLGSAFSAAVGYFSGGGISSSGTVARAAGGPVMAGTPYLVGERGPEMMIPATAGKIVPNNALGGSQVNLRVVNAFDQGVMADYMSSAAGEEVFMNLVNRNGAKIRNVVSGGA